MSNSTKLATSGLTDGTRRYMPSIRSMIHTTTIVAGVLSSNESAEASVQNIYSASYSYEYYTYTVTDNIFLFIIINHRRRRYQAQYWIGLMDQLLGVLG